MELTQNSTLFTDKKDYTITTLAEMARDGDLILNPDYQRAYVYDVKKASLLIESLLMNIPIPMIYLSEENDGTFEVIDGQQRITTFTRQQHLLLRRDGGRAEKNIKKKSRFKSSPEHEAFFANSFILSLRNEIECSFT